MWAYRLSPFSMRCAPSRFVPIGNSASAYSRPQARRVRLSVHAALFIMERAAVFSLFPPASLPPRMALRAALQSARFCVRRPRFTRPVMPLPPPRVLIPPRVVLCTRARACIRACTCARAPRPALAPRPRPAPSPVPVPAPAPRARASDLTPPPIARLIRRALLRLRGVPASVRIPPSKIY